MKFEESPQNKKYYMLRSERMTNLYFSMIPSKRPSKFIKDLGMGCRYVRFENPDIYSWALYITDVNKFMLGILKYEL